MFRTSLVKSTLPVLLAVACLAGQASAEIANSITTLRYDLAARTFEAACVACHYRGAGKTIFDRRSPLSASTPDEVAEFILFGKAPEWDEAGMPGFAASLTDADVSRLVVWLRSTAKPDAPWADVEASVARMRATGERED